MKFFNLITLVATSSSAFALPVEKRDLFGVSAVCVAALKAQMNACIPSEKVTTDNLESICSTYNSLKCKAFLKASISSIPGCDGEAKEVIESLERSVKTTVANSLDLKCAKDDSGNICPISKYVIENGKVPDDENDQAWKDAVNSTCQSKPCSEAFTNFSENIADVSGFSQSIVTVLGTVGFDSIPNSNPDLVSNTAETIKENKCSAGSNGVSNNAYQNTPSQTDGASPTVQPGDAGNNGVSNNSYQNTPSQTDGASPSVQPGDAGNNGVSNNSYQNTPSQTDGASPSVQPGDAGNNGVSNNSYQNTPNQTNNSNNNQSADPADSGNNGVSNNSYQNDSNQANDSNDNKSSDATTLKGSLTFAVIFAIFTLLI